METEQKKVPPFYKCSSCHRSFQSLSCLQSHKILSHPKPQSSYHKPRNCEDPKRMESRSGNDVQPMENQTQLTKQYECGICHRMFTSIDHVLDHLDAHRILDKKYANLMKMFSSQPTISSTRPERSTRLGSNQFGEASVANTRDPKDAVESKKSTAEVRVKVEKPMTLRMKYNRKDTAVSGTQNLREVGKGFAKNQGTLSLNTGKFKTRSFKSQSLVAKNKKCKLDLKYKAVPWPCDSTNSKECMFCLKRYSTERRLKEHISVVHRKNVEFMCDICCRLFSTPYNVTRHALIHSSKNPYHCSVCWRKYKAKDQLKEHEKAYHGIDPLEK